MEECSWVLVKPCFERHVSNHTQLDGGVIASTASAEKNSLSTQTLNYTNLHNESSYSGSSVGFSAGLAVQDGMALQSQTVQVGMNVAGDIAEHLEAEALGKASAAQARLNAANNAKDDVAAQQAQADLNAANADVALWSDDGGAGRAGSFKQYWANGQWSAALGNLQHVGSDSLPTSADAPGAATLRRTPDYRTFSLPVPFVPGVGVTFTLDRYGTAYAGRSGGAGFPEISGRSWGVGWTGDPSTPDASSLRGWVSGASYNAGFGPGVTESSPLSPGANQSSRIGPTFQSPGASVGYSWPLFGTGIHW